MQIYFLNITLPNLSQISINLVNIILDMGDFTILVLLEGAFAKLVL